MKCEYKEISVYFDTNLKLMGVPCGKSTKYDIAGLNLLLTLDPIYSETELEDFIEKLFDLCYSKECIDDGKTAIEKYTNAKSYVTAVKKLKLILVFWTKAEGYTIMPTNQSRQYKGSFHFVDERKMVVPEKHERVSLGKAFKQAMEVSQ